MPIVVQIQFGHQAGSLRDCEPALMASLPHQVVVLCGACLSTFLPPNLGWRCPGCGAVVVDLDGEAWRFTAGLAMPAYTVQPSDHEESP